MEIDHARDPSYRTSQLPLLATRIPHTSLPKSILKSGGNWGPYSSELALSLEKEVELFCEGKSIYGPYWDDVLGFWRATIKAGLFLKHEVFKKDELFYVKKMAEFMGKPFSKEEEIEGVPEKFIGMRSFKNLSNLRKGVIGDWKNLLSEDMRMMIDQTTEQKLQFTVYRLHILIRVQNK
ncbi:flavonol sulfotransferase-like [Coffea eugenioides]|uniref:flavonol sulfotransferase-like n=1 Tax=Coffea eugenioides TaxID=49369 RepID=UPI000F609D04|nr:flavonol sulfotransferase-like [Coffea eugenioides]